MNFSVMTGSLRILQAMQGQDRLPRSFQLFAMTISFSIVSLYFCANLFAWDKGYIQVPGIIHIHTTVSGGTKTINEYVRMAEDKGIGILIITDHDNAKYEYGPWFLKRFIKKVVEEDSVFRFGIDRYLELIKEGGKISPRVLVIGGVESLPFYYWTGSYFKKNLTLNNRDKHMLVIGLRHSEDYKKMPIIANGMSKYDQYNGENYVLPYQDLINYVNSKEGLTFWAHPEHEEIVNIKGVRAITMPYYEDLLRTEGYTGFSVFYEGYNKIARPGGIWDKVLMEYCIGKRRKPVWAIGELDDHGMGDRDLTDVMNIFLLKEKNSKDVLDALREGRVYVVRRGSMRHGLRLEDFSLKNEIDDKGDLNPVIHVKLNYANTIAGGTDKRVTVWIVRDGRIVWEEKGICPLSFDFRDTSPHAGNKGYYRLDISDEDGCHIISNPIFVNY